MRGCYRQKFILSGYLTIFLSFVLTIMLSIILGLIGSAMQNLGKLRFECAADIGMNSILGEFHRELLEQYDLLFVDISYGTDFGQIANMEDHAKEYMDKNLHNSKEEISAWSEPDLKQVTISEYVMASDYEGMVMRQQACAYMKESNMEDRFDDLPGLIATARELDGVDGMKLWSDVMNQIAGTALPLISDGNGGWEEVILENPADKIFATAEEQLNNLYYAAGKTGTGEVIAAGSYLSHRSQNTKKGTGHFASQENNRYLFQAYLFDKFGFYQKKKQNSLMNFQIEYIAFGENSDLGNIAAAAERIFRWRFADNIRLCFNNDSEYREAGEIAGALRAVRLKQELLEPVTHSVLYARAFIESIYDTDIILHGGQVPLRKENLNYTGAGLDYRQYLWLMVSLESEEAVTVRAMDIMEMDIRQTDHNQNFRMDWCLESYRARVAALDRFGVTYEIDRRYGYY